MSNDYSGRKVDILMIEDNPSDVRLAEEALRAAKLHTRLSSVKDGVEGLLFLHHQGAYQSAPRPDLILLDLNLPRKDGREVLAEIKTDRNLRSIPIIILTTSQHEQDISGAYDLQANCYIVKPVDFEQFIAVMQAIRMFWFNVVRLP